MGMLFNKKNESHKVEFTEEEQEELYKSKGGSCLGIFAVVVIIIITLILIYLFLGITFFNTP